MAAHSATAVAIVLSGLALVTGAGRRQMVTPVAKVISLLEDLKTTIENEGTAESQAYDTFACFCRDNTGTRSSSIVSSKQEVDTLSARIADDTADKAVKEEALVEMKAKQEEMIAEKKATEVQLAKDEAEYRLAAADLLKALDGLNGAITALQDAKTLPAPALLSLMHSVRKGSDVEREMQARLPKLDADKAFLQTKAAVDPSSPEYKYHSDGIITTLQDLHTEFTNKKTDLDADWTTTKGAADDKIRALGNKIENNKNAISDMEGKIDTLKINIAADRESLVMTDAMLKDDKVYLRDLTERCEARAKDWDQRSQMRMDELTAITKALDIIKNEVQGLDTEVNARSVYEVVPTTFQPTAFPQIKASLHAAPALVQIVSHDHQAGSGAARTEQSLNMALKGAIDFISKEGRRLKSESLSMLAMKVAADPFGKVKQLIQDLIERLIKESTAEANKESFCNTELGKAEQDRDFRYADVKKLNVELAGLELKRDELEAEITELTDAIDKLWDNLNTTTIQRNDEHVINMDTVAKAKDGLEAITGAIVILKTFYAQSGRAIALVQASPVDEDTSGPGFAGKYGGKQEESKGIIEMLEVIKTDFERTVKVTTDQERKAQEEFIEFDRVSRTDIAGKTEKRELDEEDLKVTKATIQEKMTSMRNNMALLDAALQRLHALKPMCIDFGMSFEERVQKRQDEITALKHALCVLGETDPAYTNPDCTV